MNVTVPWEFSSRLPIRSWVSLLLTSGLPVLLTRPSSPQLLLAAPRLWMALLSLSVDASVAGCARLLGHNPQRYLETLAASYVMLVFSTRTFSNSLELCLSAVMLYVTLRGVVESARAVDAEQRLKLRLKTPQYTVQRLQLAAARRLVRQAAVRDCWTVCGLLCAGVFVRPTYIAFAAAPMLYWLFRGAGDQHDDLVKMRFWRVVLIGLLGVTAIVLLDSMLYGWMTFADLIEGTVTLDHVVMAPFNFIVYNIKAKNLADHGDHWCLTHTLVNIPMLFGSLGVIALMSFLLHVKSFLRHLFNLDLHVSTASAFLSASFILPLLLLSWFPHQEARFLLPLLPPLVLLFAPRLHQTGPGRWRSLLTMYMAWNATGVLLFGFAHQGGITRVMSDLQQLTPPRGASLVFTHTYSPPQSLLLRSRLDTHLYDLGGRPLPDVVPLLRDLTYRRTTPTFLVTPAPLLERLLALLEAEFSVEVERRYWPHLSAEAPPPMARLAHQCRRHPLLSSLACLARSAGEQLQLVLLRVRRRSGPHVPSAAAGNIDAAAGAE